MIKRILSMALGFALAFGVVSAGTASADTTLGTTTQPSGSGHSSCPIERVINQVTSDAGTPYTVPGAGTITQWQTAAALDKPGLHPGPGRAQARRILFHGGRGGRPNIPTPAPSVATFTIATPIPVSGGETLGLYTGGTIPTATCYFSGGATPAAGTLASLSATSAPAPGQTLNRAGSDSPGGYTMDLAAVRPPFDRAAGRGRGSQEVQEEEAPFGLCCEEEVQEEAPLSERLN